MPTRNINLTEHWNQFVEAAVHAGHYQNASEVIRAGLRLLEREQQRHERKLARASGGGDPKSGVGAR